MTEQSPAMTSNRPYLLRAVHAWICDNGLTPYIVVDASKPRLQVPPQAINDGKVVLNLAPRAVAHLDLGNDTITLMARFGGVSHALSIPIAAVQAIYARENGQGMMLAEDPPGTAAAVEDAAAPATDARPAPALQAVPSAAQGDSASDEDAGPAPEGPGTPRPRGKPSLHVVK